MTKDEFKQAFPKPYKVRYKGAEYEVIAVDYDREEVGLFDRNKIDSTMWVKADKVSL